MHHSFNAINSSRNSTTGLPRTSTGHQASATTAESALNTSASSLPQTSALSVTANTANATSARSPAGQLSAMNTTAASSLGNTTLPFSGIRDQHSPDYLNDAAVEEDLTPEQIAELAEEHGNLSILSSSRGAAVASGVQRGSSSLTGVCSSSDNRTKSLLPVQLQHTVTTCSATTIQLVLNCFSSLSRSHLLFNMLSPVTTHALTRDALYT